MPAFTTETDVREKFQLTDTTQVTSALVTRNIDDAHEELLRFLDPRFDVPTPPPALVLGETLLAAARLLRSLASRAAATQKRLSVGGQRIEPDTRVAQLTTLAEGADSQAWELLAPFLVQPPARAQLAVNQTTPVLGED